MCSIPPEKEAPPETVGTSYSQILRSSSIVGGAQGIGYLISLARMKVVAMLLGPSGVGVVGLYQSIVGLVNTVAQLGINQSGVREVAEANGSGNRQRVGAVVKTLRRTCWISGIIGWVLTAALAGPLTQWTFGSMERIWAVILLGSTALIGSVAGGQSALLQGMRRIGDLARVQVFSAILTLILAMALYAWLGQRGIVPVIVLTAIVNLGFSWYFSRRIKIESLPQPWLETLINSKRLIKLGLAFMYGAVLAAIVALIIRSLIIRDFGVEGNGIYQAAWSLSGLFGSFILLAMGTDFYPRLVAVSHDDEKVNQLANEQIEIGILLALPGTIGTIAFGPWAIRLFYSAAFLPGADLLPWFVAGVYGMMIMNPLGMIQRVKGAAIWMYFGQTEANVVHLGLIVLLLPSMGLAAVGYAFVIHIIVHAATVYVIGRRLSGFRFDPQTLAVVFVPLAFAAPAVVANQLIDGWPAVLVNSFVFGASLVYSIHAVCKRLGPKYRLKSFVRRLPLFKLLVGRADKHGN